MRKVYEGETLSQALLKMQIDLGKDAIIVGHKKIKKGGVFGLFSTPVYQVTALKPPVSQQQKPSKSVQYQNSKKNYDSGVSDNKEKENKQKILNMLNKTKNLNESKNFSSGLDLTIDDDTVSDELKEKSVFDVKTKNAAGYGASPNKENLSKLGIQKNQLSNPYVANKGNFGINKYQGVKQEQKNVEPDYNSKLNNEIKQLKDEIQSLSRNMAKIIEKTDISGSDKIKYPGKLSEVYIRLIENEVDESLADRIINEVKNELKNEEEYNNVKLVQKLIEKNIIKIFKPVEEIDFGKIKKPYILTLIGPTGVGKTTTVAKLGANFSLIYGRKVGFITIDTYRLAAVEQLQKYAEILETPVKVIFKPEDFDKTLNDFNDMEIIIVDTAGRSPKDEEQMLELAKFVEGAGAELETCLVIQATTKYSDIEDIIHKFRNVGFKKLIITKIDETITFGPILNIVDKHKLKIVYVTTGQDVPDDIEYFDPAKLAKAIIFGNSQDKENNS
ncbi:flagellar biosynthesis protein FlhF [Candidatus Dependentiae bacterium]|nr:flagellar biosynthesis protein FlhF [Candidatus Dependentiae bacterium]